MEYKRLDDYIREVNVRNRELKVTKPMGINIDKHFMPSVANVMQLPIPDITRQREIVSEYETLTNRIRLNVQMIQHLESTAQALYRKMFVDNIDKENLPEGWRMGTLGEVATFKKQETNRITVFAFGEDGTINIIIMAKKYIEPQKELFTYTCPHCNTISQVEKDTHHFQSDLYSTKGMGMGIRNQLTIHRCQCCGKKIIWIDNAYIYPEIVAEDANADMPESVKQLYNEAGLIYNKSPRAACALLRLAIDKLCNELGETDRDINKNIGALVKKGCLNPMLMRLLNIIVERMITEPNEINSLYQGLPESIKQSIENRDK